VCVRAGWKGSGERKKKKNEKTTNTTVPIITNLKLWPKLTKTLPNDTYRRWHAIRRTQPLLIHQQPKMFQIGCDESNFHEELDEHFWAEVRVKGKKMWTASMIANTSAERILYVILHATTIDTGRHRISAYAHRERTVHLRFFPPLEGLPIFQRFPVRFARKQYLDSFWLSGSNVRPDFLH